MEFVIFAALVAVFAWGLEQVSRFWRLWLVQYRNWRPTKQKENDGKEVMCALCGSAEAQVEHLVAGAHGAVCFGCARKMVIELDRAAAERGDLQVSALTILADALAEKSCPMEGGLRSRLISALSVLPEQPLHRESLVKALAAGEAPEGVIAMLGQLPPEKWGQWDLFYWVWANCRAGYFVAALHPPVESNIVFDRRIERWHLLSVLEARLETASAPKEVEKCCSEIQVLIKSVEGGEYPLEPNGHTLIGHLKVLYAQCLLRLDLPQQAEAVLIDGRQFKEDSPEFLVAWGDVLAAKGNKGEAAEAWKSAQAEARGVTRQRVESRLASRQEMRH